MKVKKKPVVVEAFQYDGDLKGSNGQYYVPKWAVKEFESNNLFYSFFTSGEPPTELFIKTLEGIMHVSVGDYIIKGVRGELYPCKKDIFEETYEILQSYTIKEFFESKTPLAINTTEEWQAEKFFKASVDKGYIIHDAFDIASTSMWDCIGKETCYINRLGNQVCRLNDYVKDNHTMLDFGQIIFEEDN